MSLKTLAQKLTLCASVLALAASCSGGGSSGSSGDGSQSEFGFQEAMSPSILPDLSPPQEVVERVTTVDIAEPADDSAQAEGQMPVGMPQIAYRYDFGFRVESQNLTPLQQQHADLCVNKGPDICRIISMRQSGSSGDYAFGRLEIEVVANAARDFGKELVGTAESAGGEQVSSSIAGEDLSKQIVDTEARLRARTLLRDRLMEVLRSRRGTVAELVEAERGVAQVNEEIDQARSWLTEMRGRVAFSDIAIDYESGARNSGGFWEPIRWALGSIGTTLGSAVGALIMITASMLPWLLALAGIIWLWRKAGLPTWRRKKNETTVVSETVETGGEGNYAD